MTKVKVSRKCTKKQCKYTKQCLEDQIKFAATLQREVAILNQQLKGKEDYNREELTHMQARTNMITAMGLALKTCSSVMWSEKQIGWTYQTPQLQKR